MTNETYKVTIVRLRHDQWKNLRDEAHKDFRHVSEIIRELIDKHYGEKVN